MQSAAASFAAFEIDGMTRSSVELSSYLIAFGCGAGGLSRVRAPVRTQW
jgi:hypothetical protein